MTRPRTTRRPPRVAGSRFRGPSTSAESAPRSTPEPAPGPTPEPTPGAAPEPTWEPTSDVPPEPAHDRMDPVAVESRPPGRWRTAAAGWWVVAAAVVVVVASAVVTTLLGIDWSHARARTSALAEVPSLAKTSAARILSYDYRHIRADAERASGVTTGDYRDQYRQSMDQLIIPQAGRLHAVVRAEVISAGVTSVSDDGHQAVVLVYANQTVTNTRIQGSRVDQVRVRLTMVRVGHGWRVSKVDSL